MFETKKKKAIGIILWQGESLFDGERIMVIATGLSKKSENIKTGEMVQTYILRQDIAPILARRLGEDFSTCGDCKHRENSTCYVNLAHGPRAVFDAFHRGNYRKWEDEDIKSFEDAYVRFGTYGDPAAVPFDVWNTIAKVAKGFTGYTHQWKNCDQRLQNICMASVDSIEGYNKEYLQAQLMGWRTFRIRESLNNELFKSEFVCPASKEAGAKTNCKKCNGCNGHAKNRKRSPVILLHGDVEAMGSWKKKRYIALMKKIRNKKKYRRDYAGERKQFLEVCKY